MPASSQALTSDPDAQPVLAAVDAAQEDEYWRQAFWREGYFKETLDYEDYAPAYCVGYIGYAQYGGDFRDAEASLWANWVRIKGDSRLSLDDARDAMRAAWDRASGQAEATLADAAQRSYFPAAPAMHAAPG
jgi:hypothetical protein